jgi:hypothetical protein
MVERVAVVGVKQEWYDDYKERMAQRAKQEIEERKAIVNAVKVGDFGTQYVGSDRYAVYVVGVKRYKSGAKAGEVKEIEVVGVKAKQDAVVGATGGYGWNIEGAENFEVPVGKGEGDGQVFTVRDNYKIVMKGQHYGAIGFREVREYRDPHF